MKKEISKKKLRDFGLFFGFAFPIFFGWFLPTIHGKTFYIWSLWVGFPFLIFGIIKPRFLLYPYMGWMNLGHLMGWFNSKLILGFVFLIVLQPISFIMKLTGYDPLKLKNSNKDSYRIDKSDYKIDLTKIF